MTSHAMVSVGPARTSYPQVNISLDRDTANRLSALLLTTPDLDERLVKLSQYLDMECARPRDPRSEPGEIYIPPSSRRKTHHPAITTDAEFFGPAQPTTDIWFADV